MQIFNLYTCNHCNKQVIHEELETHECRPLRDHKIKGNILWVFDGKIWYPLKLQPTFDREKNNRRFDSTHSSNIYKLNTTAIDG